MTDEQLAEAHRLQSEVFPSRADGNSGFGPIYHGWVIVDAFEAGVEFEQNRLRAALQEIAEHPAGDHGDCERCEEKSEIARAALGANVEEGSGA